MPGRPGRNRIVVSPDADGGWLESLSPELREGLVAAMRRERVPLPAANDSGSWAALQQLVETRSEPVCAQALQHHAPRVTERDFGGMDALLIEPRDCPANRAPLIFLHGGGYTTFSARSSLFSTIPLAQGVQRTMISLDYPLAPQTTFETTVPATAHAVAAVLEAFPGAALAGDSAGGGLAVAVCNQLGPEQICNLSALVLISPWADLGNRGESRSAQRELDPLLEYDNMLAPCAAAYAPRGIDHPVASPLLATLNAATPPTFIVVGGREILLSDSLRLHQRLEKAGVQSSIEVRQGLPHSFPVVFPNTPESASARALIKNHLDQYCGDPA